MPLAYMSPGMFLNSLRMFLFNNAMSTILKLKEGEIMNALLDLHIDRERFEIDHTNLVPRVLLVTFSYHPVVIPISKLFSRCSNGLPTDVPEGQDAMPCPQCQLALVYPNENKRPPGHSMPFDEFDRVEETLKETAHPKICGNAQTANAMPANAEGGGVCGKEATNYCITHELFLCKACYRPHKKQVQLILILIELTYCLRYLNIAKIRDGRKSHDSDGPDCLIPGS
jgi:hypothetical protein